MYYDYHVHSHFSLDCKVEMKDIIEKAIEIGLNEICFTDHVDFDYCESSITFEINIDEYTNYIKLMRDQYGKRIKILKGLELGIQPHIIEKCDRFIDEGHFDFVISSMHTCNRKDFHSNDFFIDKTPREAYLKYFEVMLYCIKHFKNFNVIGHLNILARYDDMALKENLVDYFDILEVIFKELIKVNKGIEINTSSFRYTNTLPLSQDVLRFYRELGGEIITLGSDSHTTNTLAYKFDYIYELLKKAGFRYITTFDKMEPKFIKI